MSAGFRVDLLPSRRARQVGRVAIALTAVATAGCLAAVALAPSGTRVAVALAAMLVLGLAARRISASRAGTLAVDPDGTLRVDCGDGIRSAKVGYCGAALICLRTPDGLVAIWPDAMPATHWRRLLVACRWPHAGPQPSTPETAN
jgi:hypothetical protein